MPVGQSFANTVGKSYVVGLTPVKILDTNTRRYWATIVPDDTGLDGGTAKIYLYRSPRDPEGIYGPTDVVVGNGQVVSAGSYQEFTYEEPYYGNVYAISDMPGAVVCVSADHTETLP